MSRLFVLTIPELVPGFHLAGIEAYAAEDVETAQGLITNWLDTGETGLLAIDNSLLSALDHVVVRRLEASSDLLFVPIPGGIASGVASSRRVRIAQMIKRAIGVHIAFKGEKPEDLE